MRDVFDHFFFTPFLTSIRSFFRSFVRSFARSFVGLFVRSFALSSVSLLFRSFVGLFGRSFLCLLVRFFARSFVRSFASWSFRSFVCSLVCSIVHSFARSFASFLAQKNFSPSANKKTACNDKSLFIEDMSIATMNPHCEGSCSSVVNICILSVYSKYAFNAFFSPDARPCDPWHCFSSSSRSDYCVTRWQNIRGLCGLSFHCLELSVT